MKTLVWVEHDNASVKDATLHTVTAAAKLGEVHLLVAGAGCRAAAEAAAKIAGVAKVHVADNAAYEHALAENVAPLIVELMGHHDAFLAPATTTGKNIAPRVAALLDVAQLSDILSVEGEKTFTRPINAGNAIATVESSDAKLVITAAYMRPIEFPVGRMLTSEMTITTAVGYPTEMPEVVAAMPRLKDRIAPMISHKLPFSEIMKGLEIAATPQSAKVMIGIEEA